MPDQKVLVVDDDDLVRQSLVELFLYLDYTDIEVASSGEEAIKKTDTFHPNLVITDVEMGGGMNGIELARYFLDKFPEILIVVVSGRPKYRMEARELGLDYLEKPYGIQELIDLISKP